jgi:hypothetical protein
MSLTRIGASVEGGGKIAGKLAHAEGLGTVASGQYAHAEGSTSTASADSAHAEGSATTANGAYAHAEGSGGIASGGGAHAEGSSTLASGNSAHAEGAGTTASGYASHARGLYATANRYGQSAQGSHNPSALSATFAQYSTYTIGGAVAATNGSTVELTFDGNAPAVTGASTNVLVIPLKSTVLVNCDFVIRPNAGTGTAPMGASFSGSVLCGRGSTTGGTAYLTQGTASHSNSGNVTIPLTYGFSDTQVSGVFLQMAIVSTDTNNNYVRFVLTNSTSGIAWSMVGVLRCVELVTSS